LLLNFIKTKLFAHIELDKHQHGTTK